MRNIPKKVAAAFLLAVCIGVFLPSSPVFAGSNSVGAVPGFGLAATPAAGQTNASAPTQTAKGCGTFEFGCQIFSAAVGTIWGFLLTVLNGLLILIVQIQSAVLALIGILFDKVLFFSTNGLSDLFNISAVNVVWTFVRDTLNVFFVFILLYIAISQIIGAWGVHAKQTLGSLILSAVFINFSMFIAKFIIDAGNIFAVAFYNQIVAVGASVAPASAPFGATSSISYLITNFTSVASSSASSAGSSSLNVASSFLTTFNPQQIGTLNSVIISLLQILVLGILAYIFIWAIILFLGRTAMLFYLVITSPIGFIGNVMPRLAKESDEWWKNLVDQVLVAPVFLFFLYLVLALTTSKAFQNVVTGYTGNTGSSFNINGYLLFLVVAILLLRGLEETKNLSGKVAGAAMGVAKGALAVGAVVATGGAAAAAGGLGSLGGAVAGGETAGIRGAIGRVSGSLRTFPSTAYKAATGQLNERPGVTGIVSRGLSGATTSAGKVVEGATLGLVSAKGIKEEQARVRNEDTRREKELKDQREALLATDKMISDRAQAAVEKSEKIKKSDLENENKSNQRNVDRTNKVATDAQKELADAQAAKKPKEEIDKIQDRVNQAVTAQNKASSELAESTAKLTSFQNKMIEQYNKAATELGVDVVKLQQQMYAARPAAIGKQIKESQINRLQLGIQIQQNKYSPQAIWQALRRGAVTQEEKAKVVKELYKNTEEEKEKK